MSAFDHSAHAAAVAGVLDHLGGNTALAWKGQTFPALVESIPPRLAGIPGYDRKNSNEVLVVVTIARALFAAKQVPVPGAGDSFRDAAGRNYRIHRPEGAPTDAEARWLCGHVTTLPA